LESNIEQARMDAGDCGFPRVSGWPDSGCDAEHLSEYRFRRLGLWWVCRFRLGLILVNGKYDFKVAEVSELGRRGS
jgi:hypothetical protein